MSSVLLIIGGGVLGYVVGAIALRRMRQHPWQLLAPRWFQWSLDVREDWKAWLGFAIPMLAISSVVLFGVLFGAVVLMQVIA